ncbi:class I SAM-dependent DNA methyltransferase [Paenibacillus lutrae]|uniref:Methyltransferase domain-containing protein n=1 Tax=Paenibacillus lutrae TaxID=2078573 RepID=A0A7X3FH35_9BACL|nr:class I SAM-dependent methyltransferase [Paenibacillus lutrae]MVO99492.1 methyltransferase domain-containing protein [Paenibacillus lutrae]
MSYQDFAYTYDRLMEDMPYEAWISFAKKVWAAYGIQPETVVDLGCGTGNISIPLARDGYKVTGIDLSDDMLAVAQHKAERQRETGPGILWLQQDLRDWELPQDEGADTVVSFCDCFNYLLEEEDILQAFEQAFQGLRSGGVFLFDVHSPAQFTEYAALQPFVFDEEDIAYLWTCELDEERTEIEHALTIFVRENAAGSASGEALFRRIEETHHQRAYDPRWMLDMLAAAGFTDLQISTDFEWKEKLTPDSRRLFFSARKP